MSEAEPRVFCASWFKPVIVATVLTMVVVVAWTIAGHSRPTGPARPVGSAGALAAATAPPITAGAPAPHPDFGRCPRCHEVQAAGGVAPRRGAAAVPVASAPPIAADARLVHPDWGPCKKCHAITGAAAATPAAYALDASVLLGARVEPLSAKRADLLEMEGVKGPVVTQVVTGTPAASAGLKVDDAILKVDNRDITSAAELRAAITAAKPGAKLKLQIARGERKKNIFVRLPAAGPDPGALAAVTLAPAGGATELDPRAGSLGLGGAGAAPSPALPLYPWRVAIAATAPRREAQVAPVLSAAPYFLLRDGPAGQWGVIPNPNPSALGRGQAVAGLLAAQGVGVLIAGNVGPGAFATLRGAGVQVYSGAFGAIEQVYAAYRRGLLLPAATTVAASPLPPNLTGILAIAAAGPAPGSAVAPSLGTAPYIVLYDLAAGRAQILANPGARSQPEGETQLAQLLVDRGAAGVVAGELAPATLAVLAQLHVMGFAGVTGTVSDAVGLYVQGRLRAATLPPGPARAVPAPVAPWWTPG